MSSSTPRSMRRRTMSDINMVPFIDVMLVLLIIFMVTAPLMAPSMIDIPSVGKASAAPDQVITVEIDKKLNIMVKSRGASNASGTDVKQTASMDNVAALTLQLQAGNAATPVVISADKHIAYENVVKLMDSLQRAGVQRVGLSVQLNN
ncbi:MAG: ExbD/TolR family protein [Betaproteobacteria bacterium]|nr:ExbD/TolR family protein [Betaproteobacteria bacterium]